LKVLIIGYGSIGKRHYEILNSFDDVSAIDVVTKQDIDELSTFKSLQDIKNISIYDYYVIATETSKHFGDLDYICKHTNNKNILVEKPLFDKEYTLSGCNNHIYVAYNLRFHPLLQKLKEILKDEEIYYVNILAGQYLPTWRLDQDYRESYSAKPALGGGVLRDLSHELDYIHWLFGDMTIIDSINTKISDLEIESDDIFTALAKTDNGIIINVTMDYISKTPMRRLTIHTKNKTIEANFVNNYIELFNIDGLKNSILIDKVDRNYTYSSMHRAIHEKNSSYVCSFEDGVKTVKLINNINFRSIHETI